NDGGSEFARIREVVSGTEWPDTSILTGRIHEHGAMLSCALEEWNGCVVEVHKSPTAAGTRGPQEVAERPSQAPNGKRQATASPYSRNEHARSRASSMGVGATRRGARVGSGGFRLLPELAGIRHLVQIGTLLPCECTIEARTRRNRARG